MRLQQGLEHQRVAIPEAYLERAPGARATAALLPLWATRFKGGRPRTTKPGRLLVVSRGLDGRWVSLSCAWLCYRTTLLGASNGRKRSAQSPGAAGIRARMASTQKTSNEAASHVIASRVPSEIPQVPSSSTCERVLKQGLCATATCSSNFRPHHRRIQSCGGTDSPLEWRMTADEAVLADPAAPTSTSSELTFQQHPTDATADHKRA